VLATFLEVQVVPMMTLMLDGVRVIEIVFGCGKSTPDEMLLMVTEKKNAMEEADAIVIRGGSPSHVIENYQKIVAANVARMVSGQPLIIRISTLSRPSGRACS
jgi:hypothetical protein